MLMQMGLRRIKSSAATWAAIATTSAIVALAALLTSPANAAANQKIHIVAFGDSLTAGYNLPPGDDFASRLEVALNAKGHDVRVSNAGVSGDTTSGGLARFDWAVPDGTDAVILELGANDVLRGIRPAIARANLDAILTRLEARNIPVLIGGMRALANWGDEHAKAFDAIFPDLARKHGALLYPFFLEGVIDKPGLKLPDALHPNKAGVDEIVRRILPDVEKLIGRVRAKS